MNNELCKINDLIQIFSQLNPHFQTEFLAKAEELQLEQEADFDQAIVAVEEYLEQNPFES